MLAKFVQPIHFEDFNGHQFERLVFAYFLRTEPLARVEWYGQIGNDRGRDIVIEREKDNPPLLYKIVVQCSDRKDTNFKKVSDDFQKIIKYANEKPNKFIVVTGGKKLSTSFRDKVALLCRNNDIKGEAWSSEEFEERLHKEAEPLLKRFCDGEPFPDTPAELDKFVQNSIPRSDNEILAIMSELFDRPAFYTPFQHESNVPAFKQAITDTIEALNTGIHRLRDGTEIRRIPSRHMVKSEQIKKILSDIEKKLAQLRWQYDDFLRSGDLKHCTCKDPNCPVFFFSPEAQKCMDNSRREILGLFKEIYPSFSVVLYHF
jgi:hypothetical protein